MTARKPFTPRAFHGLALNFLASAPRVNLYAGMGMGKTVMVLSYLDALYSADGQSEPTLIVAPKRVAEGTWPDELAKWDHLAGLEMSVIAGTPGERRTAMRRDAPIYTVSYDNVPWLIDQLGGRAPFRRIVADESTRLKSFRVTQGGARARALGSLAHKLPVREWVNLSGKPAPNGLKDLWGQAWFLDEGLRLGRSYSAFQERWFGYRRAKDAVSHRIELKPVIFPFAQEQIQSALSDISLTLDPKDWFDLKKPIVIEVAVDLPPVARRHYDDMEKEMFTQLEGFDIEAFGQAGKTMKCLQCANGALYVDPDATEWREVHDMKIQALESIVEEAAGAIVLVAYHFKSDLARLKAAFPKGIDISTSRGLAAAKRGEGQVWFAHPASMGHGIDGLQDHCNMLAFFGHWWDMDTRDQMMGRVGETRQAQADTGKALWVYNIVARDTIDEVVLARHDSKRSVQELFLSYMKRKQQ